MELSTKRSLPITVKGTWESAREWHGAAGQFEQCKLYCQVMLGFELIALQKDHAQPGKRTDLTGTSSHDGKRSFVELLEAELKISSSSAYRFMDMAKASATRLKKLPELRDFNPLGVPLLEWKPAHRDALQQGVRKLTDGQTQKEFAEQLGLWKVPQGQNGGNANPVPRRKLSLEEQAAALKEAATKDWQTLAELLLAYGAHFVALSDEDVTVQTAILEEALTARKTWLRQPLTARDPKAIAKLFTV